MEGYEEELGNGYVIEDHGETVEIEAPERQVVKVTQDDINNILNDGSQFQSLRSILTSPQSLLITREPIPLPGEKSKSKRTPKAAKKTAQVDELIPQIETIIGSPVRKVDSDRPYPIPVRFDQEFGNFVHSTEEISAEKPRRSRKKVIVEKQDSGLKQESPEPSAIPIAVRYDEQIGGYVTVDGETVYVTETGTSGEAEEAEPSHDGKKDKSRASSLEKDASKTPQNVPTSENKVGGSTLRSGRPIKKSEDTPQKKDDKSKEQMDTSESKVSTPRSSRKQMEEEADKKESKVVSSQNKKDYSKPNSKPTPNSEKSKSARKASKSPEKAKKSSSTTVVPYAEPSTSTGLGRTPSGRIRRANTKYADYVSTPEIVLPAGDIDTPDNTEQYGRRVDDEEESRGSKRGQKRKNFESDVESKQSKVEQENSTTKVKKTSLGKIKSKDLISDTSEDETGNIKSEGKSKRVRVRDGVNVKRSDSIETNAAEDDDEDADHAPGTDDGNEITIQLGKYTLMTESNVAGKYISLTWLVPIS